MGCGDGSRSRHPECLGCNGCWGMRNPASLVENKVPGVAGRLGRCGVWCGAVSQFRCDLTDQG